MENTPSLVARSISRVRLYRAHKGWTLNRLAKEAELTESSIRFLDADTWNPESKTLARLEAIIPSTFKGDGTDQPEQSSAAKVA